MSAPQGGIGPIRSLAHDPRFGRLPALLLGLTLVTGVVDACSILRLGRVFVANMTGNVAFVGFAAAGAHGFSLAASLLALGGFVVGAAGCGRLLRVRRGASARVFGWAIAVQLCLLAVALVVALCSNVGNATPRDVLAAVLAVAMGIQNAAARWLAVPDLTTTVLTMAITGIAAEATEPPSRDRVVRRLLTVASMLSGAVVGATLVLRVDLAAAIGVATFLVALIAAACVLAPDATPPARPVGGR